MMMPNVSEYGTAVRHDCCSGRRRDMKHCQCWCHAFRVIERRLHMPTAESYRNHVFKWGVWSHGNHWVIGWIRKHGDQYQAYHEQADDSRFCIGELQADPWEAVRLLAEWSRT